jgi:hypothetical protein
MLLDALAERQSYSRYRQSDTAELRFRSLRLLGITVTIVGLILSATAEIVGRGATYAWTWKLCWLLILPIAVWLVARWRKAIFARIEASPRKHVVLTWILARREGSSAFVAATLGGVLLLADGVRAFAVRQASQLDATRKVLAYLFRREVAKQAEARSHRRRLRDLVDAAKCGPFHPEGPAEPIIEAVARAALDETVELTRSATTTLTAVVGERGIGKTTFVARLVARLTEKTCVVRCPPEGFNALLRVLADKFEATEATEDAVAAAINAATAATICVDDAQLMIEPTIGGLEDIDRFTGFALRVGGDVSWVVAVDDAAWQYLVRARGDRVFFDQVIELRRWSEEHIAELVRKRTAAAGMQPSFEELVFTAQVDDAGAADERERSELGYYRILWDHSRGNPGVALHAWRHSLFAVQGSNEPRVQLFEEPAAKEIEKLPLTLLFVLRGIIQLDVANEAELASCTQLPLADVADAIRFASSHGYVERVGRRVRVTWGWYRTITAVLIRQYLLAS